MVFGLLKGLLGGGNQGATNVFRQTLTLDDATYTADGKTLDPAQFNDVWVLKVPAQQLKTFGQGAIVNGVDNRGILYISAKDNSSTPVQIEGQVRLVLSDANRTVTKVLMEERTERLRASETDRNTAYMLGEFALKAKEDSYLIIQIKPDAAKTFSKANSKFDIPVTTITL